MSTQAGKIHSIRREGSSVMGPSIEERMSAGKTLRQKVSRNSHNEWIAPSDRPDPIAVLQESDRGRLPELLPIRYGRMQQSPFAFFRGSAAVMAWDLSRTPATGIRVQACGDCHASNFGGFASPERQLLFDINDFDETLQAPWEWDMKESLWSMDLFRCESVTLRTHWVLVVMDQYTRRLIGFGVHAGTVDGVALCRMFNRAIRGQRWLPKYLSSDHDPLYKFHQWQANLRILEVTEIKTVPYVPLSHPFVDANIWITCCSGRVQISRINSWISGPTSTTIAPITHGKGERRICQCHHPSPICARFAGNHTVEAYIRHPWPLEFSKMCDSCDMQVSVGKNSE